MKVTLYEVTAKYGGHSVTETIAAKNIKQAWETGNKMAEEIYGRGIGDFVNLEIWPLNQWSGHND